MSRQIHRSSTKNISTLSIKTENRNFDQDVYSGTIKFISSVTPGKNDEGGRKERRLANNQSFNILEH